MSFKPSTEEHKSVVELCNKVWPALMDPQFNLTIIISHTADNRHAAVGFKTPSMAEPKTMIEINVPGSSWEVMKEALRTAIELNPPNPLPIYVHKDSL